VLIEQLDVGEHLAARPVGYDAAGIEKDDSPADLEDHLEVVSGDEHRAFESLDEPDEASPSAGVEVRGRLVHHKHRRTAGEDSGEAGALALAEAEVMRWPAGHALQVDAPEAVLGDSPRLGGSEALVERTECHILEDGIAKELIVRVLEH
jgi:hypothetical protein